MKTNNTKIKLIIQGPMLQAARAISSEFEKCGKIANILLSTDTLKKNIKLNDEEFNCLYKGVVESINNKVRYPNKTGNEYKTVIEFKKTSRK